MFQIGNLFVLMKHCKSGNLRVGEIYTSYEVSLNPRIITMRVKKVKSCVWYNSCIHVFNSHVYCLTSENAYFTTSVNNHFYLQKTKTIQTKFTEPLETRGCYMYNQCFNSHFWNKYSYERRPLRIGCNILCALFLLSSEQYIRIFTLFFLSGRDRINKLFLFTQDHISIVTPGRPSFNHICRHKGMSY